MSTETRYPTINGNDYYVKIVKNSRKKRVSVYNDDNFRKNYRNARGGSYITEDARHRGFFFGLGPDNTPSIETMVQETLNEAVCIRENKQEKTNQFENKIGQAIEDVEEAHEE